MLRLATREDVPAILEIYNDAVVNSTASYDLAPVSLEDRLAWFDEKTGHDWPILVAIEDGDVIGWGTYGPFRAKPGYRFTVEHSVYVKAARRGGGIGTELLRALIERARSEGRHVMIAGVDAHNEASLRFHEALGFKRVAHFREIGRKFGRWLDLVFLQLLLEDAKAESSASVSSDS
ncbi:GNAT family N-acetyltransferase [Deinococcus yavapaiensis]|uniref:Phosphinothricin acetyltransferase n=1 Tax=Deinococcus yavapaiensis KR-236 TaxID=694435 RepID=A0A318SHL3_9DEIO|nr:GNAT family N-acetyltransferase [Deinococcus yavapaiensis]PYE56635.1 phosphinothricin acetyltransferase [Deinococcus yavapaiensis KR-236]